MGSDVLLTPELGIGFDVFADFVKIRGDDELFLRFLSRILTNPEENDRFWRWWLRV
jgi:hypothetical protein